MKRLPPLSPDKMDEAEKRLLFLQRRREQEIADHRLEDAQLTREEYSALHERWAAARQQGAIA